MIRRATDRFHRAGITAIEVQNLPFLEPVETSEPLFSGKEKHKHTNKKLEADRCSVGMIIEVSANDYTTKKISATETENVRKELLTGVGGDRTAQGTTIYSAEAALYKETAFKHESVTHIVGELVAKQAYINGMQAFWAVIPLGFRGTVRHLSEKHLDRYDRKFIGNHSISDRDTISWMPTLERGVVGKFGAGR